MEMKEILLTKDNLLKIMKIDNTFYINEITSIDWYLERYNEHHKAIVLVDNDEYVGYIAAVPIRKELYDAINSGVLVTDLCINPKMYIDESYYHYISSCVIKEKYRGLGYSKKILEKLLENAYGRYCALTVSEGGYKLTSKYLDFKLKVTDKVSVFVKEFM